MTKARPLETIGDLLERCEPSGECMEFTGALLRNGYGRVRRHKKYWTAHRLAYHLAFGGIPKGMNVCHRCDNRKCLNPKHLFAATQSVNILDMVAKGRRDTAKGERKPNAKLTGEKVRQIRDLYKQGVQFKKIAVMFCVDRSSISRVARCLSWKHV